MQLNASWSAKLVPLQLKNSYCVIFYILHCLHASENLSAKMTFKRIYSDLGYSLVCW